MLAELELGALQTAKGCTLMDGSPKKSFLFQLV